MSNYHFGSKQSNAFSAYSIFLLGAMFYLYEYILQVSPSVMAEPMMKTFNVTAEGFGVISAFYFYAYAPMQLPAGILFDRYGPRKLMTAALMLCAFGAFFFALTDSVFTACVGRFLIGIGSAFSFIGILVLISRWFPPHYFAILAGVAQLMSSVGAIFGEMPLASFVQNVGWRQANFYLAGAGFLLALLLWCVIRDYPDQSVQSPPKRRFREECQRLVEVCSQSYTWLTGLYAFSIWTPIAIFAALWGVPFLQEKYQIDIVAASGLCTMIWVGIGIGSPLLGWVSDRFNSRRLALITSSIFGLSATLILLYLPNVPIQYMYVVLFFLGVGSSGQTVSFAVVKDNNPPHLVGTASGFNNLSVLIGGAVFQPLIGVILNRTGSWYLVNDVPVYTVSAYQTALLVMPCCYLASFLIALLVLKESHPDKVKLHLIKARAKI